MKWDYMRRFLADLIFYLHTSIVVFWYVLFFIPGSWWQNKVTFHFYYSLVIVLHQLLWGLVIMPWTKKYRMVCILTTFTQLLRGEKISDPRNYDHSFTKEFLGDMGLTIPHRATTILTFSTMAAVTVQYIFFR